MSETLQEIQSRIEPTRKQLETMLERKELSPALFFKALMGLAYEYVVADHTEEAAGLVMQIPPDYWRGDAKLQMQQDVQYFQRSATVYRSLRDCGLLMFAFPLGQPSTTAKA